MKLSKIKDYIVLISSILCLGVISAFCLTIGINFSPKSISESFSFESKKTEILRENYLLEKGNIDAYDLIKSKLIISENSYVNYHLDTFDLNEAQFVEKDQLLGKIDNLNVFATGKGIVTNIEGNTIQIYYFNSFEILITCDALEYYSFDFETAQFKALINNEELKVEYNRVDLSRMGSESEADIYLTCTCSQTIVTKNSLRGVYYLRKAYKDALFISNNDVFDFVGQKKKFSYQNENGDFIDFFLESIDNFDNKWIVDSFIKLNGDTTIYGM